MSGYNFTEQVRRALTNAREAAVRRNHSYVGTEHILIGLIETGAAAKLLDHFSIDVASLQRSIESVVPPGADRSNPSDLPYTYRGKKVLELAMTEASQRGDSYVGTEHVMLGLIREENGIAAQVLADYGVKIEAVRALVSANAGTGPAIPSAELMADFPTGPVAVRHVVSVHHSDARVGVVEKVLLVVGLIALIASGIGAAERGTWVMEVFPIVLGVPLLILTARRFPLTPLVYGLIFIHALILMLGGHYTYAKVPLGFWMQDAFHLARNHYDRIGHFAQGFVPAIIAREILIRRSPLRSGKWLFFLVTCICMTLSVSYEFIEWAAALAGGSSADAFLGTQGDVWDTQWDMFMALIGALTAQVVLSRVHDRQLQRLTGREG